MTERNSPYRDAAAGDITALAGTIGRARTILYVHGIGNKPIASILKCQWDHALFGFDLGERSRLAYWVNRDYYPMPEGGTCKSGDLVEVEDRPTGVGLSVKGQMDAVSVGDEVADVTDDPGEQEVLTSIAVQMEEDAKRRFDEYESSYRRGRALGLRRVETRQIQAKILPLPEVLRKWITRKLTRAFVRDSHDLFFVEERRELMRESVRSRLRVGGGPFVVIGHSQGSMIAYDVLSSPEFAGLDVPLFVTIGSPLGIQEVQDQLRNLTGQSRLHVPACVDRWINVADPIDPVAFDKGLGGDYAPNAKGVRAEDDVEWNGDSPRHPHSGSGYLRTRPVRHAVSDAVATGLFQPVADFVVARDVVRSFENSGPLERQPVLIQLAEATATSGRTLNRARDSVVRRILELAAARNATDGEGAETDEETLRQQLRIEELRHYVAADLTRAEAEALATAAPELEVSVRRIWKNSRKTALLDRSAHTVQAPPAHSAYQALGRDITWAVLDSGVNQTHPHFELHRNIACVYDCTKRGSLAPLAKALKERRKLASVSDENGHGTHVAGIIAGAFDAKEAKDKRRKKTRSFRGIAPETSLHVYRVLDREGQGEDAWIIKALDHIAETNERAGKLVVHGVNLSLGGPFDQSTYGCGHTPLCAELRRLWRQGVVVVLAAGNEGFAVIETLDGTLDANMDISIGDPANLEEAIAVGAVHKENPHTYGVSYFSSRGPTADGRQKPDVVAPGERIWSCRHHFQKNGATDDDLYVEMSGTSMAAPHVSGILAAFLSVRREFIGYPDRVKEILLQNCTDLRRDRFQQGHGLPNLVKMLVQT